MPITINYQTFIHLFFYLSNNLLPTALAFVKQCSSVINPRINAGSEQQMASGVKGLNIVIQVRFYLSQH